MPTSSNPSGGSERRFVLARGPSVRVALDRTQDLAQIQFFTPGLAVSLDLPAHDLARIRDHIDRVIEESGR